MKNSAIRLLFPIHAVYLAVSADADFITAQSPIE